MPHFFGIDCNFISYKSLPPASIWYKVIMDMPNSEQIGWWFDSCSNALVLFARQWLGASSVEDVAQEVYLRLARQLRMPENPKQ